MSRQLLKYKPMTVAGMFALAAVCHAQEGLAQEDDSTSQPVRIIEPDSRGPQGSPASIDTERFELGAYLGALSVEDFSTEAVSGIEFGYYLTDDWLLLANYGMAEVGRAAFESSDQSFLADSDREFEYFGVLGGYNLLNGRSFFGARNKYETRLYGLAGAESVSFAGSDEIGFVFGLSYRVVFTDWLTANLDFREHVVKRDFLGDDKQTFNTEMRIGINALF